MSTKKPGGDERVTTVVANEGGKLKRIGGSQSDGWNNMLAVSFQQIVHPVLTEETEVAEASDSEGKPDEHA